MGARLLRSVLCLRTAELLSVLSRFLAATVALLSGGANAVRVTLATTVSPS